MGTDVIKPAPPTSIDDVVYFLTENMNEGDHRPAISFGFGDPSGFDCFRTTPIAEDAMVEAVRSAKFNSYASTGGILPARRAVADYLSRDLPYRLSPDDVFLTLGCNQAAEITVKILARPGANILLPRPGYPDIEAYAAFNNLEIRQFDLLPEKGWEVDLDSIEAIADTNTIAMIAETAGKLGIVVIADEFYGHLVYGSNPFVPMSLFASIVPVFTLGSVSKRWMITGWGLGWLVTCDPSGLLRKDELPKPSYSVIYAQDILHPPLKQFPRSRRAGIHSRLEWFSSGLILFINTALGVKKCFKTCPVAEDAIVDAVRSARFNSYASFGGIFPARRAVAEYLSRDLRHRLSPDDVYLTLGCRQAVEIIIKVLARPGANILFPRPGYPNYEAYAALNNFEFRHYDLLPERGWEVDLGGIEALADENTIAMVIINPGNPCGNVYKYEHLNKIAETARRLGILVIADEVYGHLVFGSNPFVPMNVFASTVPVITLGAISKRWMVPGWRLGWLVTSDPSGWLRKYAIAEAIQNIINFSHTPVTFIQGAIPQILEKTTDDFFSNTNGILRENLDFCYDKLKEIPCMTCPQKAEGGMFIMVKLNLPMLEDIEDDMEFCLKLAKEESLIVLPGITVGLKNWTRITFGVEHSFLEDGLGRLKAFCHRHAKKH
ncbi:unnamed protein product [Dovyalis caffra]|uniref:Aminotransferase class I/classII large domain-containing protein n=1 Tax=Dovyalis caffra TaxID=77055 RepID=A0AAV1QP62_9ROSI|nr:unnamed protein product [Dovyalis caffra]